MHFSACIFLLIATSSYLLVSTYANTYTHPQLNANVSASCKPHERDALLAFKQGITNDPTNLLASWRRGHDCCTWTGVTCSKNGHVIKLDLNNTYGNNPPLVGQISPSLLSLKYLEYLDLSRNMLNGPRGSIPEFIGSMKNMRHLDLSCIPFSGRVPPHLGNLSNLRYLDLSFMQNVYSTDISWLSHLHFLEYIDMSNTSLSTIVGLPLVVNMIPSIKHIILKNCSLPSANHLLTHINLTKLVNLDLSENYFGHSIAFCWFWNVTSIKSLSLDSTFLHGPFPDALGGMIALQALSFQDNVNGATMAVDMKNLCQLAFLSLDRSLSSGNITEFIENLPQCSNKMFMFSSSGNNMTGILPNKLAHLTSLVFIDLSINSISGAIPPLLWNLTSLEYFYIRSNKLSGQIPLLPRSLRGLDVAKNFLSGQLPLGFSGPNLEDLVLSSNHLMGQVPESICESELIDFMDLSNNFFQGELPNCSKISNINLLLLSNNSLSGGFPPWIRNFNSITSLDLSSNKFYGVLPSWIGELSKLRFLQLSNNMLYGEIPVTITNLRHLQYLNLAANNFSGWLPLSLSNLIGMTLKYPEEHYSYAYGSDDGWPVNVLPTVVKHEKLKYVGYTINYLVVIDLSLNQLTGGIPEEISFLDRLFSLNLSWNQFRGKIPEKIGRLKALESLDLSRNKLSNEIPESLTDLTSLSSMDFSYNSLTGRVPSGRQLDTLYTENPSMYDGNDGLCGPLLQKSCSGNNKVEHGNQEESNDGSNSVFFYMGLWSGFVVGLCVVLYAVLFSRKFGELLISAIVWLQCPERQ